jgi:hypothetical protein
MQITGGEYQLQFPIGKSLYGTQGKLGWLAFSPRGDRLAFIEYPLISDEAGTLKIVDLEGRATTLSRGWRTVRGVDWSSSGNEIWVTASDHGRRCSLYGVRLTLTRRVYKARRWSMSSGGRARHFSAAGHERQVPAGEPAAGTARTMNRCGAEPT